MNDSEESFIKIRRMDEFFLQFHDWFNYIKHFDD